MSNRYSFTFDRLASMLLTAVDNPILQWHQQSAHDHGDFQNARNGNNRIFPDFVDSDHAQHSTLKTKSWSRLSKVYC